MEASGILGYNESPGIGKSANRDLNAVPLKCTGGYNQTWWPRLHRSILGGYFEESAFPNSSKVACGEIAPPVAASCPGCRGSPYVDIHMYGRKKRLIRQTFTTELVYWL